MIERRYQLEQVIGSGGMGTVYRAYDRLRDEYVALKQVEAPRGSDGSSSANDTQDLRLGLAQEFRVLSTLRHPRVISVLDYGFDSAGSPYFTMEMIPDAQTIVDAGEGGTTAEKARLLMQMLEALSYLHHRQVVHCDIKPSNVLISGGETKVLDFGLSLIGGQRTEGTHSTAGTLAYLAPEVLAGGLATPLSDLYSAGVVTYELLLGIHPYDRRDLSRMIKQILYTAPDLSVLDLDLRLTAFIERLLAKTPEQRYPSAYEAMLALSDAAQIPMPRATVEVRESYLRAAQIVGREAELNQLQRAIQSLAEGTGCAWLIGGESGVGKSRLLEEVRTQAMVSGATVVTSHADDQGAVPYQLWIPLFRWLPLLDVLRPADAAVLNQFIATDESNAHSTISRGTAESVTPNRLAELISKVLSGSGARFVVLLEDLHWASEESITLLRLVVRQTAQLPILWIGTYRNDELPTLQGQIPEFMPMELRRLNTESIQQLATSILGKAGSSRQLAALLEQQTEGNAFFVVEVIRALASDLSGAKPVLHLDPSADVRIASIDQMLEKRLSRLSDQALRPLAWAAVSGRSIDMRLMRHLFSAAYPIDEWQAECANSAVLEYQHPRWQFAHDRVRNLILQRLDPEQRREMHGAVARAIETTYADLTDHEASLAYHWGEFGDLALELHYSLLTAARALPSGVYQEVLKRCERVQAIIGQLPAVEDAVIVRVRSMIGEACLGLGRYSEARQNFETNLTHARVTSDLALMAASSSRLGDIDYVLGDFAAARERHEAAVQDFRDAGDQDGVARSLDALGNIAYELGDDVLATRLFQESLSIRRSLGKSWGMAGSATGETAAVHET